MRVLQVTVQIECASHLAFDSFEQAKEAWAHQFVAMMVSSPGTVVGFAVEELDSEGLPPGVTPEVVGGDTFPVGEPLMTERELRPVATPFGPIPQPSDDELRETRDHHPADGEDEPPVIGLVEEESEVEDGD